MNGRNKKNIYTIAICILLLVGIGLVLIATRDTNDYVQRSNDIIQAEDNVQTSADITQEENTLEVDIVEPDMPMTDAFDGSVTYKGKKYEVNRNLDKVLFLGVDNSDLSREGAGIDEGARSDTIILFLLDNDTETITPLEINRDTMVDVDIYDNDGKYISQGEMQLTMQYSYGDDARKASSLTKEKVSDLLGRTRINSVISLTMDGIEPIVDSIGGVTLKLLSDETEIDPSYKEGTIIHLDGASAEDFVHLRDLERRGSNEERMSRQTQFMLAMFQTIKAQGNSVIETMEDAAGDYLYKDIDADTLSHFAQYEYAGDVYTLPGTIVAGNLHDEFYVDDEKLTELILDLFYKEAQ